MKLTALLLAAALLVAPVSTAPAHASETSAGGEICMFQAPTGAERLGHHWGHVGWAYRWANGNKWDFGATERAGDVWNANGTFSQMLDRFRIPRSATGHQYYRYYKCGYTTLALQSAAFRMRAQLDTEDYHVRYNNCLTRSLMIFKAYDDNGELDDLGDGSDTSPNWFFDTMQGFGDRHDL